MLQNRLTRDPGPLHQAKEWGLLARSPGLGERPGDSKVLHMHSTPPHTDTHAQHSYTRTAPPHTDTHTQHPARAESRAQTRRLPAQGVTSSSPEKSSVGEEKAPLLTEQDGCWVSASAQDKLK